MALATWRYLTRQTRPARRVRRTGPSDTGPDPDRPLPGNGGRIQRRSDGHGPVYRRSYRVRIAHPTLSPEELVAELGRDLNLASPVEVAEFDKVRGSGDALGVGDEYVVRMPGPWDGPVRVAERTPCSFRLVTLKGHMEAGEIDFCARPGVAPGQLEFEIRSWARSGTRLFDWLYDRLWFPREMQLHMWVHFCERVAQLAGGWVDGPVVVTTERGGGRG
jgi:hypothetical protein